MKFGEQAHVHDINKVTVSNNLQMITSLHNLPLRFYKNVNNLLYFTKTCLTHFVN